MSKDIQADGRSKNPKGSHYWCKRFKNRGERRKAKRDPECVPGYGRYHNYET